jgi:hypothetical protein
VFESVCRRRTKTRGGGGEEGVMVQETEEVSFCPARQRSQCHKTTNQRLLTVVRVSRARVGTSRSVVSVSLAVGTTRHDGDDVDTSMERKVFA